MTTSVSNDHTPAELAATLWVTEDTIEVDIRPSHASCGEGAIMVNVTLNACEPAFGRWLSSGTGIDVHLDRGGRCKGRVHTFVDHESDARSTCTELSLAHEPIKSTSQTS